jgi:hypothetical protein
VLKGWPDHGQLTETCCHNKIKINIIVFDENQKTILLSFSVKTQWDAICKEEKEKQFGFPRN